MTQQEALQVMEKAAVFAARRVFNAFPAQCKDTYSDFSAMREFAIWWAKGWLPEAREGATPNMLTNWVIRRVKMRFLRELDKEHNLGLEISKYTLKDGTKKISRNVKFHALPTVDDDGEEVVDIEAREEEKRPFENKDVRRRLFEQARIAIICRDNAAAAHGSAKEALLPVFDAFMQYGLDADSADGLSAKAVARACGGTRQAWNVKKQQILEVLRKYLQRLNPEFVQD